MAYATSNPPNMVCQSVGAAPAVWVYASEDVHTDVDAANYFTNGKDLGMRVNDLVMVIKTTATIGATAHVVTEVSSDGATVSAAILA
ncbi:hypothetical protein GOC16_08295 [Sinorhizobium meliloti]|nr:hypothetical protein [Sinorhizobium meliloti]